MAELNVLAGRNKTKQKKQNKEQKTVDRVNSIQEYTTLKILHNLRSSMQPDLVLTP